MVGWQLACVSDATTSQSPTFKLGRFEHSACMHMQLC